MHKALHPRDYVDRLYLSRKEGGRWIASIQDSVDASIQRLENYTEMHGGRLITATRNNSDDTGSAEQKYPENKNGKKNHSMDVLND